MKLSVVLLCAVALAQPKVETRSAKVITQGGLQFRDLNKNGVLDPYEDWRLPAEKRVADLLGRMTLEEKAGLMVHSMMSGFTGPNGEVLGAPAQRRPPMGRGAQTPNRAIQGRPNPYNVIPYDSPGPATLIGERNIRYLLVRPNAGEAPDITAKFHNALQEMAEASRLGIPIIISTDPRHGASAMGRAVISEWPDQLGLAATGDAELVRTFGKLASEELRAIGIRCLLGPMADVATEPRWNRINGTFGEDFATVEKLTRAFVEGMQGPKLSPTSVMTVVKHFPGDGPVKDGYDGHNSYGKWYIYPGAQFDAHLKPFQAAIQSGTGGIMTAYGIPVGKDTVGVAFSKAMVNGLLRQKLGFNGLVVTDWLRNMPWGVEKMSEKERQRMMIAAGVDQIGGDSDPKFILENVKDRNIPAALIDAAARRALKPMFEMGLFEDPYVDLAAAKAAVASAKFTGPGLEAQHRSFVLLKNANSLLPAETGKRIYIEGIKKEMAAQYGTVVEDPKGADLAILRVASPATTYPYGGTFAMGRGPAAHGPAPQTAPFGITLAYSNAANWQVLEQIRKVAATGTPTVVVVNMDKPVILTEFIEQTQSVFGAFGGSDAALLDVIFGKAAASGKLPFDLPSDMPSVMAQAADVAFDMDDPLFKFGFGLTYPARH